MLIGVISDTHNQIDRTRRAMELLVADGVEAVIHCGDFTRPEMVALCATRPLYFVFGNNDSAAELEAAGKDAGATCLGWGGEVTLGGRRIAVTHGHRPTEARRLLAAGPDYLLFGHSHVAVDELAGAVHHINPGALHRASRYTVAVLDLQCGDVRFVEVPR
ncbi:MAG: metallophosphoesterase family protein [Planctomycetaceae bacterium]|nr:metallophosphoesterase family protein [Planctomycetaceae bacterium]